MRSVVAALVTCALAGPVHAIDIRSSEETFLKINLLMQPWIALTNDPQSDTDLASDFFLRRTRLILSGQVVSGVGFFFETDNPNWGKGGNYTPDLYIQDAFVTFDLGEHHKLDLGMLLPPFVHQARQGATNLHTLDYHGDVIKFPKPNKAWRDMGVELRGLVLDHQLDYRLSITNGKVGATDDIPRFSARVAWNFFDAEEANFLGGTYLGKKKVLSIGIAADTQPDIVAGGETYYALGADVFWDIPLGDDRVSGQVDLVHYRGLDGKVPQLDTNGQPVVDAAGNPVLVDALTDTTGTGVLFDCGYAFGKWEPLVALAWFHPEGADFQGDLLGVHLGLNYWMEGHAANVKLDLGLVKAAGRDFGDATRSLTLQTQLLF